MTASGIAGRMAQCSAALRLRCALAITILSTHVFSRVLSDGHWMQMSASNYNWVCFDCRFVTRQPKTARRDPKCGACGSACYCLGYKVEVPKKSDAKGWKSLRYECGKRLSAWYERQAVQRVREAHDAEHRLTHLRSLAPNKDREKLIADLRKRIRT